MYAIEVVPIARGIFREKLTYFSAKEIPLGSIVEVPLRNSTIRALVINRVKASEAKTELRSADFSARKISALKLKNFLSDQFIETAQETARFFSGTTGAVLNNLIPKTILENAEKLKVKNIKPKIENRHEKLVLQANEEDRFTIYRGIIREEFAKKFSVLFIVPTLEDINKAKEILEKGIEEYVFCFSSNTKKKEVVNLWNKAISEEHPILVIATAQYIHLPRHDYNIIVIERENSSAYRQLSRPFVDTRVFAEILSKKLGIKLLFGDFLLRTETVWRQKNMEFSELTPMKFRSIADSKQKLAVFSKPKKETGAKKFELFSEEILQLIKNGQEKKENFFVFGSRKGLYPLLLCLDCGKTVECENCQAPLSLHQDTRGRFLMCHKCSLRQSISSKCKNCQSWRLETFGIGLELIEEELKENFPEAEIMRLDKDVAKTSKQAQQIISKFSKTPGAILCGSEMTLFYLNQKVDNVICATIDSLFSIPDFRINEKIMSILLRLRTLARKNFIAQTRLPELSIWQHLLDGNLIDFYREEIEMRKSLNYPPFSLLIKITIQGEKEATKKEADKIAELLENYETITYPSFISKVKGKYLMNVLIKISPKNWPDDDLLSKLSALSPKFTIKIDPENIL